MGLDLGEDPMGGQNQQFADLTDIFVVSHPSQTFSENSIEIKSLSSDDYIGELKIDEKDYPYLNEQQPRIYGLNVKIQSLKEEKDGKVVHTGFEVTVLDLPKQSSLSTLTD